MRKLHISIYHARTGIALLVIVLLALYNLAVSIQRDYPGLEQDLESDEISVYIQRFEDVRDSLRSYRICGYIDDGQHPGGWFLAQYALAPTVLVQGAQQRLVVANLHLDSSDSRSWVESNLELLHDFGRGVRLYRGEVK